MKHRFVSTVVDASTATDVQPGDWNDEHVGQWTGSTGVFPEVLSRDFNSVVSSNSTALTTAFSYSVPARALGTNRMVRLTAFGDFVVGSTVTNTHSYHFLYGAANRWSDITANLPTVQTSGIWEMKAHVAAMGTSDSRRLWGELWVTSAAAATTGIGEVAQPGAASMKTVIAFGSSANFAITTGAPEAVALRFNWANVNSSFSWRKRYAMLELV